MVKQVFMRKVLVVLFVVLRNLEDERFFSGSLPIGCLHTRVTHFYSAVVPCRLLTVFISIPEYESDAFLGGSLSVGGCDVDGNIGKLRRQNRATQRKKKKTRRSRS